jgi:hypothetical protein
MGRPFVLEERVTWLKAPSSNHRPVQFPDCNATQMFHMRNTKEAKLNIRDAYFTGEDIITCQLRGVSIPTAAHD